MIHHVTISTVGRVAAARDETERRRLVRALVRAGKGRIVLFALVDDHLHAVLTGSRPRLLARDVRHVLRVTRGGLDLDRPHLRRVNTRSHLQWLVTYLLQQPAKHGIGAHPALYGGSCFPDLVGARMITGFTPRHLRAELPRLTQADLLRAVGLRTDPLRPAPAALLRDLGPFRLVEFAAAALGVGPQLVGRRPQVVRARTTAAVMGVGLGHTRVALSEPLAISPQQVGRLAKRRLEPALERAVRLRLAISERIREQALRRPA